MPTDALFQRFYFSKPWYVSGTVRFHELIRQLTPKNAAILEIGAGPTNGTSDFLATLGRVSGLDIDQAVRSNRALAEAHVFQGKQFPFSDGVFSVCVSNYVLEHVPNPVCHFKEIARVLTPGGVYIFRTPNLWHYVTIVSRILPHSAHLRFANKLRGLGGAHDPYPTTYLANSRRAIAKHARKSGMTIEKLELIEPEPSYGAISPLLFFPMMAYERIVNSAEFLSWLRVNLLGVLRKT